MVRSRCRLEMEVKVPEPPPVTMATRPLTEKRVERERVESMVC